jgi:hypothetical protein
MDEPNVGDVRKDTGVVVERNIAGACSITACTSSTSSTTSAVRSHRLTCCYYLLLSSCKVVTKEHRIPEKPTQRITCCYCLLLSSCKVVTKDHSIPENPAHRIACCYYLLLSSCKVVTKEHSIPENPAHRIACRARNPRFLMPLFGHKTGFRARMNEIKSGIPCSDRMLLLSFVIILQSCYKRT